MWNNTRRGHLAGPGKGEVCLSVQTERQTDRRVRTATQGTLEPQSGRRDDTCRSGELIEGSS